jgi:hypothetical protein
LAAFGEAGIGIGVLGRGAAGEGFNFRLSLGRRNAALQSRDDFERVIFAPRSEVGFDQRQRNPEAGPNGEGLPLR